ncbi:MAG: hypothetical protein FWF36_04095 [Propionibacteriaceae bacterium]|nr:hypothetical protein [Propionibacteriaceae bacterium]
MIVDIEWSDEGAEGHVTFPWFKTDIELLVSGEVEPAYVEECVKVLDSLSITSSHLALDLMAATWRYWHSRARGLFRKRDLQPHEVIKQVQPTCLVVIPPAGEGYAFSVEFNCDWEKEHGMGWCVRNDEMVYVGPFEDNDPWDDSDTFDRNFVAFT